MKLLEVGSALVLTALLGIGLGLIVFGTGINSVDRYLVPPEILPGLAVLYLSTLLAAVAIFKVKSSTSLCVWLRDEVSKKVDQADGKKLRTMFLVLTCVIVALAMTPKASAMYRVLVTNYPVSLFANLLVSIIANAGLFGWLASLFVSKPSRNNS